MTKNRVNIGMYTYVGYSLKNVFLWKVAAIRRFLGELYKQRSFRNIHLLRKTRLLKNSRSGPALVCATGRSLNFCPEELIDFFYRQKSLFGISHYLLSNVGKRYPPNYQVLIDESHFNLNYAKDKAEFEFQKSLKMSNIDNIILRHVSHNPIEGATSIPIWGHTMPGFTKKIDPTRTVGFMPNSSLLGIATALYLGYSPIFVVGLDYNYHAFMNLEDNSAKLDGHHAYDSDVKNIALKGRERVPDLLGSIAWTIDRMNLLNSKKNVFTVGSFGSVDAFERISIDQLAMYVDHKLNSQ
jgi:hypothetical protein